MTLFHVVQSSKYSMADDRRFQEVRQRMEAYQAKLDAKGCEIDVHLHFGTTTYNILEAAREIDATLIVLGTTGKGYLRGATLGSTSEEVVKGSPGRCCSSPRDQKRCSFSFSSRMRCISFSP